MKAKVSLEARVNDGTGTFPRIPCRIHRRAIQLPVERKKDGRFFGLNEIIGFYARYRENGKRKPHPLGKDVVAAYTQFQQIEQDFARVQKGLLPLYPSEPKTPSNDRDIHDCAEKYKARLKTLGKKNSTISQYTRAVDDFVDLYTRKKSSIDDITREDILDYIEWMRSHLIRRQGKGKDGGKGDPQHVYRNRYRHLMTFFNHFNVKPPMPMRDIKNPGKVRPWKYSDDVINLLLSKATREQKDLIQFVLNTGFRDAETSFATWGDIDLRNGSINVHPKPQFANRYGLDDRGWMPKNGASREQDIVLSEKFVKIMIDRKNRMNAKDADLIFPTPCGNPNIHLLKIVRRAAKSAEYEGKIALHAFRRTFGTKIAHVSGIEQARIYLGHADIATTQRYLAADEMTTKEHQRKSAEAFKGIGD